MAIVNFAIPKPLERRGGEVMKEKGFSTKAEFFRFAAIHFIDVLNKPYITEDERFDYLTHAITDEVTRTYRGKKVPSLRQQLSDKSAV